MYDHVQSDYWIFVDIRCANLCMLITYEMRYLVWDVSSGPALFRSQSPWAARRSDTGWHALPWSLGFYRIFVVLTYHEWKENYLCTTFAFPACCMHSWVSGWQTATPERTWLDDQLNEAAWQHQAAFHTAATKVTELAFPWTWAPNPAE